MQRYYGYYANRTRGERRKAEASAEAAEAESAEEANAAHSGGASHDRELPLGGVTIVEPADFSPGDARRRWAELIMLID